jgi:hypothetical protein
MMDNLATELLHELKRSSRRNFILAIILLIALITSNIAWLEYESQWEETETTTLSGDSATYLENSESGDINYGNYTQSN